VLFLFVGLLDLVANIGARDCAGQGDEWIMTKLMASPSTDGTSGYCRTNLFGTLVVTAAMMLLTTRSRPFSGIFALPP
jgi:hypothetical protein